MIISVEIIRNPGEREELYSSFRPDHFTPIRLLTLQKPTEEGRLNIQAINK